MKKFEELQIMKFVWHNNIPDLAVWKLAEVEEVEIDEYQEILAADGKEDQLEQGDKGLIIEVDI